MVEVLVYLEDGNTTSYEVADVYKAVEHAFRIINEGWRNESVEGRWMEYYVPEETLKVVIKVPETVQWTDTKTPEVTVELKDGASLTFDIFFEKSLRELAHHAKKRGFGFKNRQGDIEVRPKHQVRKIYWAIEDDNKDYMMSKYETIKV
jgi:hypothetical protein